MKYINLAFDDNHVQDWGKLIPFLDKHNIMATFYLAFCDTYTKEDWDIINKLIERHHIIGSHGLNHLRAGVCDLTQSERENLRKPVHQLNWIWFLKNEIEENNELIYKNTGWVVKHYSYPMGNRTDNSDKILLGYFNSIKRGGGGVYLAGKFPRVFGSLAFDKRASQPECGHEKTAINIKDGEVFCCYMHRPIYSRLEFLVSLGYKFITIEDLCQ